MAGNSSFKIKWLEKPEYKCLSQIQSKFKAASCNVCIKDINISNIGGRVHLKVTFSQQSTLNIKKSSLRLSMWVNNQVEPASVQPTKKLLEESVATTDFIKVEI
jgi:hypothetical protein